EEGAERGGEESGETVDHVRHGKAAEGPGSPIEVIAVRYILPGVLCFLGVIFLVINPGGFGVELFSMLVGSGLSVLLLNALFRFGAKGDEERREEEEARDYYSAHGHWPDEAPPPR